MEISKKTARNVGNKKYCKRNKRMPFGFISTRFKQAKSSDLESVKGTPSTENIGKKEK